MDIQLPLQKKERQIAFKKTYMQIMQECYYTQVTDTEDKQMIATWKHASEATRLKFARAPAEELQEIVKEMIIKQNPFLQVQAQIVEELKTQPRPSQRSRESRTRSTSGTQRKTRQSHSGNN